MKASSLSVLKYVGVGILVSSGLLLFQVISAWTTGQQLDFVNVSVLLICPVVGLIVGLAKKRG